MSELKQIADEWRESGIHGEIPAELFTSITDGAKGWEKRVVKNIAFHSVLFKEDGSVKDWNDIVSGWEYVRSTFGSKHFCEACGKNPISENCHIRNEDTGEELIIGNLCVIRYLDISVDGIQLSEEEKREFLTGKMTEARKEFYRKEFMNQCPDVWDDLKRFEDLLIAEDPNLLKSMVRRMRTHGFPGKVLEDRWLQFLSIADVRLAMFNKEQTRTREKEEKMRIEIRKRAQKRAAILDSKREERKAMAGIIDGWMDGDDFWSTPQEAEKLESLKRRLLNGGIATPNDLRLHHEVNSRMERIRAGYIEGEDTHITWLRDLDPEPLTNAEQTFRMVCLGKAESGLNAGDRSTIRRMKIRYGS